MSENKHAKLDMLASLNLQKAQTNAAKVKLIIKIKKEENVSDDDWENYSDEEEDSSNIEQTSNNKVNIVAEDQ